MQNILKNTSLIFLTVLIIISNSCFRKSKFELLGEEKVELYYWEKFIEPGFIALDKKKQDIKSKVIIENNIDYKKPGTYKIKYSLDENSKKSVTLSREIKIIKPDYKEILKTYNLESLDTTSSELNKAGFNIYKQKEFLDAAYVFLEATKRDPDNAIAHFNFACALSLFNSENKLSFTDDIFTHLEKSLQLDSNRYKKLKNDADLASIRQTAEYNKLLTNYDFYKFLNLNKDNFITEYIYGTWSQSSTYYDLKKDGTAVFQVVFEYGESCEGSWRFNKSDYSVNLYLDCISESGIDGSISNYKTNQILKFDLISLTLSGYTKGDDHVNMTSGSKCPLIMAIKTNNIELLDKILSFGVDINEYDKLHYMTRSIQLAIESGHPEVLKYLVNKGADLFWESSYDKETYLIIACKQENINDKIVTYFLEMGLDPNHKDKSGKSASDYLSKKNKKELLTVFNNKENLEKNDDLDSTEEN